MSGFWWGLVGLSAGVVIGIFTASLLHAGADADARLMARDTRPTGDVPRIPRA